MLGTSGTLLDLAKGASGQGSFDLPALLRFKRRLWKASAQERVEALGVDPRRAEVLHVGASWAWGCWSGWGRSRCAACRWACGRG